MGGNISSSVVDDLQPGFQLIASWPLARVQAVIRTFKDSDVDFAMDAQQLQDLCSITLPLEEWRAEHFVRNLAPTPKIPICNSMSLLLLMATMSDAGPEGLKDKFSLIFDTFDFNGRGRIEFDELVLLLVSLTQGLLGSAGLSFTGTKLDDALQKVAIQAFKFAKRRLSGSMSKATFLKWATKKFGKLGQAKPTTPEGVPPGVALEDQNPRSSDLTYDLTALLRRFNVDVNNSSHVLPRIEHIARWKLQQQQRGWRVNDGQSTDEVSDRPFSAPASGSDACTGEARDQKEMPPGEMHPEESTLGRLEKCLIEKKGCKASKSEACTEKSPAVVAPVLEERKVTRPSTAGPSSGSKHSGSKTASSLAMAVSPSTRPETPMMQSTSTSSQTDAKMTGSSTKSKAPNPPSETADLPISNAAAEAIASFVEDAEEEVENLFDVDAKKTRVAPVTSAQSGGESSQVRFSVLLGTAGTLEDSVVPDVETGAVEAAVEETSDDRRENKSALFSQGSQVRFRSKVGEVAAMVGTVIGFNSTSGQYHVEDTNGETAEVKDENIESVVSGSVLHGTQVVFGDVDVVEDSTAPDVETGAVEAEVEETSVEHLPGSTENKSATTSPESSQVRFSVLLGTAGTLEASAALDVETGAVEAAVEETSVDHPSGSRENKSAIFSQGSQVRFRSKAGEVAAMVGTVIRFNSTSGQYHVEDTNGETAEVKDENIESVVSGSVLHGTQVVFGDVDAVEDSAALDVETGAVETTVEETSVEQPPGSTENKSAACSQDSSQVRFSVLLGTAGTLEASVAPDVETGAVEAAVEETSVDHPSGSRENKSAIFSQGSQVRFRSKAGEVAAMVGTVIGFNSTSGQYHVEDTNGETAEVKDENIESVVSGSVLHDTQVVFGDVDAVEDSAVPDVETVAVEAVVEETNDSEDVHAVSGISEGDASNMGCDGNAEEEKKATVAITVPEAEQFDESAPTSLPLTSSSLSPSPVLLQVGDEVEARFKGRLKWFPATITTATYPPARRWGPTPPPSFALRYADGDTEDCVPRIRVRRSGEVEAPASTLLPGIEVEARYQGGRKCYPGLVVNGWPDGEHFMVEFEDGDKEPRVHRSMIFAQCVPRPSSSEGGSSDNGSGDDNGGGGDGGNGGNGGDIHLAGRDVAALEQSNIAAETSSFSLLANELSKLSAMETNLPDDHQAYVKSDAFMLEVQTRMHSLLSESSLAVLNVEDSLRVTLAECAPLVRMLVVECGSVENADDVDNNEAQSLQFLNSLDEDGDGCLNVAEFARLLRFAYVLAFSDSDSVGELESSAEGEDDACRSAALSGDQADDVSVASQNSRVSIKSGAAPQNSSKDEETPNQVLEQLFDALASEQLDESTIGTEPKVNVSDSVTDDATIVAALSSGLSFDLSPVQGSKEKNMANQYELAPGWEVAAASRAALSPERRIEVLETSIDDLSAALKAEAAAKVAVMSELQRTREQLQSSTEEARQEMDVMRKEFASLREYLKTK